MDDKEKEKGTSRPAILKQKTKPGNYTGFFIAYAIKTNTFSCKVKRA